MNKKEVLKTLIMFLSLLICLMNFNIYASGFTDNHDDDTLSGWTAVGARVWLEYNGSAYPDNGNSEQGFLINDYNCTVNGIINANITADQWSGYRGGIVFRWNSVAQYYYVTVKPGGINTGVLKFYK